MKVSVVVPTITGREESLARTVAAYEETLSGYDFELIVEQDHSCWPVACNAGTVRAGGDVIHYGADDLVPYGDWLTPCLPVLERGELPAPRVWNFERAGECWSEVIDGPPGSITRFTRVPILTREMAETIGPWPEIIYFADCWVSDAGRHYGWPTRVVGGYDFVHHISQIGRLDGDSERMAEAHRLYDEAVGRFA